MSRAVRTAALLYSAYATLLLLEALWISVGTNWFTGARAWAALHGPGGVVWQVLGSVVGFLVGWSLMRGYGWAWFVAVVWGGGLSALGAAMLVGALLLPDSIMRSFVLSHPTEMAGGAVTVICLGGSVICLSRRDARQHFRPSGPS